MSAQSVAKQRFFSVGLAFLLFSGAIFVIFVPEG
jgi:hypothetical protein